MHKLTAAFFLQAPMKVSHFPLDGCGGLPLRRRLQGTPAMAAGLTEEVWSVEQLL